MRLVYYIVSKEYPTYIHDEDIIQSGMVGLCKAAESWDETRSKFSTYAGKCIKNEINQEFIKRKPHSKVLSLDTPIGEDSTFGDMLVGEDDIGFIDDATFVTELSKDERYILYLDKQGYSTEEIVEATGWGIQKVRKIGTSMEIKVRYHADIEPLCEISGGDWIDLRAAEDVELKAGEFKLISLGVSMKLPDGYEAHVIPRSSTFKNWGVIQTNHFGLIDNSYCGDNDIWRFPAYAMRDTVIHKNDRICQFRIQQKMPTVTITTVEHLDSPDRGGFGSTGRS